jgi:hypothetical protein
MELPYRLALAGKEPLPSLAPYLVAEAAERARWAGIIATAAAGAGAGAGAAALRVGVVWACSGCPNREENGTLVPENRSLPAAALLTPLAAVPGVRPFCRENRRTPEEASLVPDMVPLSEGITDLAETAGALVNLDLVITCDTSVAHLAGALGVPTWVLLPYFSDWRWGPMHAPCTLYPSITKYQQQEREGDWEPVIARVVDELASVAVSLSARNRNSGSWSSSRTPAISSTVRWLAAAIASSTEVAKPGRTACGCGCCDWSGGGFMPSPLCR